MRAFVAGAGHFHHQIWAKGCEAPALLGGKSEPAIETHQGGLGAEHGVVRWTEPVELSNAFQVVPDRA